MSLIWQHWISSGDMVSYYFEIWDNDAVNGSKSSKEQHVWVWQRSTEEMTKQEEQNNADIKAEMEKSVRDAKITTKLADFKIKCCRKKTFSGKIKRISKNLWRNKEDIQKNFEDAKKKFDDNLKTKINIASLTKSTGKTTAITKMMNESMSDEMK